MDSTNEITSIFTNAADSIHTSKSHNRTLNLRSSQSYQDAEDTSNDEPLLTQHIRLDFTPDEIIDNEFAQLKCCKFWDFINNVPEIQHLMVLPEKINPTDSVSTSDMTSTVMSTDELSEDVESKDKSTRSVLKYIEDKELINPVFETKMPQSKCSLGSREYKETENITGSNKKNRSGPCHSCIHGAVRSTCPCKSSPLKTLISTMEDWDSKHPKSMEPPGHAAPLQNCTLQRRDNL